LRLEPNFPNPFNPRTTISYWLSRATRVRLAVYDARGRHIATLVDATMPSGTHATHWDGIDERGRKLASGVYLIRAEAGSERSSQSIVLMK
jgi:flagellar hook assembly protein FlgD